MYKSLYKLKSKPFELHPDPAFLWLGGKYKEAFSVLRDGMVDNMGFVLLTGAAGMGKTTLINGLTRVLKNNVVWAVVSDPGLERIDLYNKIGSAFGIEKKFISKVQFLIQFSHFLHKAHDAEKKVVLFVDDCHLLNQSMLEELNLLVNIERDDARLIDIFFVGQPGFNEMLDQQKNKDVRQRLGLKARLVSLGKNETVYYIKHRLKISGTVEKIFSARAFQVIHHYSQGVPRSINMICEQSLRVGFQRDDKTIDYKLILECVQNVKLPPVPEMEELKPSAVEIKPVEPVGDKPVSRNVGRQPHAAGLSVGKRRVWFFGISFFLVCTGLWLYFSSQKEEIPIIAESSVFVAPHEHNSVVFDVPEAVSSIPVAVLERVEPEASEIGTGPLLEEVPIVAQDVVTVVEPEPEVPPPPPAPAPALVLPPLQPRTVILGLLPGEARLTVDAENALVEFVEVLLQYPNARVVVKGFVSSNNDTSENMQLSEERAASVQQLLIERGVGEDQIEVRGMGIKDPVATNDTPTGRLKNRRVEVEVIDDGV